MKIIAVDDIAQNRTIMGLLLERMGYDPELFSNGKDALKYLESNDVDLVFLDMLMPEMSGIDVAHEICKRKGSDALKSHHLRIVAVTANTMNQDREACLEAGMDDFLGKPLRFNGIQEVIVDTSKIFALKGHSLGGSKH